MSGYEYGEQDFIVDKAEVMEILDRFVKGHECSEEVAAMLTVAVLLKRLTHAVEGGGGNSVVNVHVVNSDE